MDITSASVVYTNNFYTPNYVGDQLQPHSESQLQPQHQSQIIHGNYMAGSAPGYGLGLGSGHSSTVSGSGLSPRTLYNDLFRFEDGGGDASGSLMIGPHEEDFCEENEVSPISTSSSSSCQAEDQPMNMDANLTAGLCLDLAQRGEMVNENPEGKGDELIKNDDMGEDGQESAGGDNSPYIVYPPSMPVSSHSPYMNVGRELYIIQLETVFVLGMRLNVTKNEIMMFFGKLGLIKVDENTGKPKIFVYKNKITGRSKGEATITYVNPLSAQAAIYCLAGTKFMGQTISVLPAYLSMRKGTSVRYSYPRDLNAADQLRRQRLPKWKPAVDNWVCLLCRNSNFVWRTSCNRCQTDKITACECHVPVHGEVQGQEQHQNQQMGSALQATEETSSSGETIDRRRGPRKNDWSCDFCLNLNFWYRLKCNRCHVPRTEVFATSESEEPWEVLLMPPSTE